MVQEQPSRVERRLSAILAADVAGYSRLMHNDEEATHARLTMLLTEAVEPSIAQHGGRVVKNTGDGLLAEFRSAVEAVRAATQFQKRVHDLTINDADEKRLAFRVGINIGDIIVEPMTFSAMASTLQRGSRASPNQAASAFRLRRTNRLSAKSRLIHRLGDSALRILLVRCVPTPWSRRDPAGETGGETLARRRRICRS